MRDTKKALITNLKMNKIRQVWVRYTDWEDFNAGMWRKASKSEHDFLLKIAIEFTGNHLLYGAAMQKVVFAWPQTMINSLTNNSINQRAFLGHCACCYEHGIPESITRQAWFFLTDEQRFLADEIAQKTIDSWKILYSNKMQLKIPFNEYP